MQDTSLEHGGLVIIMPPLAPTADHQPDWGFYQMRLVEQLAYHYGDRFVNHRGLVVSSDMAAAKQLADTVADSFDLQQEVLPTLTPWAWMRLQNFALRHVYQLLDQHDPVVVICQGPVAQKLALNLVYSLTTNSGARLPDLSQPFDLLELDLPKLRQYGFKEWDFRR